MNTTLKETIEKSLSLQELPQELREAVLDGLTENTFKRVLLLATSLLTNEEAESFTKLTTQGDITEALAMIRDNHPQFDAMVQETIDEVLREFTEHLHK